jgi:hypothetical protein
VTKSAEPTPEELVDMAIAPLDRSATLEQKLDAFVTNLGIAEALDSALRHASRENSEHVTLANKRLPIRVALMVTMEFLVAAGVGNRRTPKTLWRLLKALAELDDSGKVGDLFISARTGRGARLDTGGARNLKIASAVATEIAHKDCGWPLPQATKRVARELDKCGAARTLGRYDAGTVGGWRNKCIGAGDWSPWFRESIALIRAQEASSQRRLKRALYAISQLSA